MKYKKIILSFNISTNYIKQLRRKKGENYFLTPQTSLYIVIERGIIHI